MAHPSVGSPFHPTHSQSETEAVPSPTLHRALESLMVNLDDELLRYRHNRTGQGPSPTPQRKLTFRPRGRTSPSLISLKPTPAQPSSRGNGSPSAPPSHRVNPIAPPPQAMPTSQAGTMAGAMADQRFDPSATGSSLMPYTPAPDSFLESSTALLGSAPSPASAMAVPATYFPESYDHEDVDYRPSLAERISTPLGVGALLLLLVGSAGFGYLVTSPTAIDHLRNHAWFQRFQPAPTAETEAIIPEAAPSLPTGLQGIGPDLSGQELGELDLDRVSRLPVEPSRSAAPRPVAPVPSPEATAEAADGAETTVARPQPRESPATGTLRTEPVVPLTPRSSSSPTTVAPSRVIPGPAQAVPQGRATPAPAPPRPAPPVAAPAPPAAPPAPPSTALAQPPQPLGTVTTRPTPPPTAPAPPPPLSPTASSPAAAPTNYYVVTDYTGNSSLESARGVVGDAYVRTFQGSTKIQMGAFSQESSARDLVQQLQQQGIPAQIYNTP